MPVMFLRNLFVPVLLVAGETFSDLSLDGIPYRQLKDKIQRSRLDSREYLGLELNNNLRVLLVSDPHATKAEVALTVGSGANDDPDTIPGLAHLCEHLVVQGNGKNPGPNDFQDFLASHGGSFKSMTDRDFTRFYFNVDNWGLDEGLESFSRFFVDPKFDESVVEREAKAINYEFTMHPQWSVPFEQAALAALNSSHPATRFSIGNYATLITNPNQKGINIRNEVVAHYDNHYSSNLMHLVVTGNHNFNTFKKIIIPRFSSIKDKHRIPTNAGSPFNANNMPRDVLMNPQERVDQTIVRFTLDPIKYPEYQTTLAFFEYLLQDRFLGSLKGTLVKKGLIAEMNSGIIESQRGFSLFTFVFYTTSHPNSNKYEILRILFAYLNAIKAQAITQERYNEFLKIFRISPLEKSQKGSLLPILDYASELATRLHHGAHLDTVLGHYDKNPHFNPHNFIDAINKFNTSNFILYESKNITGHHQTEPWFGFPYASSKFNSTFLNNLGSVTAKDYGITLQSLPPFDPQPIPIEDSFKTRVVLLSNDSIGYVVSVNEKEVNMPSTKLEFFSDSSPNSLACLDLLREMTSAFDLNNGTFTFGYSDIRTQGNTLTIALRDEPVDVTRKVATFAKLLKELQITPDSLKLAKESFVSYMNGRAPVEEPFALSRIDSLLDPYSREYRHKLNKADSVTLVEFKKFIDLFLGGLKFNIIGSGYNPSDTLLSLKKHIISTFNLDAAKAPFSKSARFIRHGNDIFVEKIQKESSEITFHLHLYDTYDTISYALAQVTQGLVDSRFHHLRNDEQLALYAQIRPYDEIYGGGFTCYLQSDQPGVYLESRIEAFLESFVDEIKSLPESKLNATMASFSTLLDQPPANLAQYIFVDWETIQTYLPRAQRAKEAARILQTVSKHTFIHYLETHLLKSSSARSKISVHVNPIRPGPSRPTNYTVADCGDLISDYTVWHQKAFEYTAVA
ncbi:hypothetical protein DSO57_1023997 [Entomophthora muscae]|uniref:Uncharacterized protein n=1 Tax=Entomophthora muscae TaxID=34485 RepID=A0ACC2SFC4_9FUNG|nr:hypothetical protein DSO57_1023997 [Entomophthora muscae]